jgi:hypothetical protein
MAEVVDLKELGDQPRLSETAHSRRARFHQSWYRASRLGIPDWGSTPNGRPLGSILPDDHAAAGVNFTTPQARDLFLLRRTQGWGVDPVRMTSHMTSSQALLVNLMGPLCSDSEWLLAVLQAILGRHDVLEVVRWDVEFAPPARSRYLGDMTRVDAFFRLRTPDGIEGVVLELKYTDRFSSRRLDLGNSARYRALADRTGLWPEPGQAFSDGAISQLLRCHALGARTLEVDNGGSQTTLLLVSHPADQDAVRTFEQYQRHLGDPAKGRHVGLDRLLDDALATAPTERAASIVHELRLRYLDHDNSERLWVEHLAKSAR